MMGMNKTTGEQLTGIAHLRQSIADILVTPIGSRVMRPEYGSRLYELVDAPLNASTLVDIYAATAEALVRWEPRFELSKVKAIRAEDGQVVIDLQGRYLPEGKDIFIEGVRL